jgi:hypothetical protein
VEEAEDGWRVQDEGRGVDVVFELPIGPERRCVAVGIIVHTDAPGSLRLELESAPDTPTVAPAPPTEVILDPPGTYAAVVELDATPRHVTRVRVRPHFGPGGILVHDLFVISYG